MVEMAGIEPASERLERQTSTSVSGFVLAAGGLTCSPCRMPAARTRKPSFA